MSTSPIVILGVPRSGTKLLCRVLAAIPDTYLVSDHYPEQVPETHPVVDADIWNEHFAFHKTGRLFWKEESSEPRAPMTSEETMRDHYLRIAGGKRLIIKNPQNLARFDTVTRLFPEAIIIWAARNPWGILDSAYRAGAAKHTFFRPYPRKPYLRTMKCLGIPASDIVGRAATGLSIMANMWSRHQGYVVSYDQMTADPEGATQALYDAVGANISPAPETLKMAHNNSRDYARIREIAAKSPNAEMIDRSIRLYEDTLVRAAAKMTKRVENYGAYDTAIKVDTAAEPAADTA